MTRTVDYNKNKSFCRPRRRAENTMKNIPSALFLSAVLSSAQQITEREMKPAGYPK